MKRKFPAMPLRAALTKAQIKEAHALVYDIINYTPDHALRFTGIGDRNADLVQSALGKLLSILEGGLDD